MTDLSLWLSPHDPYQTVDQLVGAISSVKCPGLTTRVMIPTAYGMYLQGAPGISRTIGNELAPNSFDGIKALRATIEAKGVPCDGWCVPRGIGNSYQEGYFHGQIASLFDKFVLNFEVWSGTENNPNEQFWTHPTDDGAATQYMTGFWDGIRDSGRSDALNGNVGLTWVTNSMLTAASDPVKKVFIGGTHYDALEAYLPGDPNLDPANARIIWMDTLKKLSIGSRRVLEILEKGDIPSLIKQYWDDFSTNGVQIWTASIAANQQWPQEGEDQAVIEQLQGQIAELQQLLQDMTGSRDSLRGVDDDLGHQLDDVKKEQATLDSKTAELQGRVDALVAERDKALARAAKLDGQVNDLQAQLAQVDAAAQKKLADIRAALKEVLA